MVAIQFEILQGFVAGLGCGGSGLMVQEEGKEEDKKVQVLGFMGGSCCSQAICGAYVLSRVLSQKIPLSNQILHPSASSVLSTLNPP